MDDHAGNIIYLIVIVVAAIGSIVSKMKKANKENEPSPSTPRKSWQEVIREITGENEEAPVVKQQPVKEALPFPRRQKNVEPKPFLDSESKIHNKREMSKSSVGNSPLYFEENQNTTVEIPDFSNYDEIKKGIIFNEIFSRKF
jgi:hypothetical protein